MRRESRYRRVGVADLMIVIAAFAAGLSLGRELDHRLTVLKLGPRSESRYRAVAVAPFLASGSLAVLIVRARQPRPSRRRIARQPGSLAAIVALGLIGLRMTTLAATRFLLHGDLSSVSPWWISAVRDLASQVGLAIVASWFALLAAGLWCAEPSWIDRAGRLVALGWITLFLVMGLQNWGM